MRRGSASRYGERSTHRGVSARWVAVVCAALSVLAAPVARAQGTPAGTRIQAWATVTFDLGDQWYTIASDTAECVVAQVAGADVEPPRVLTGTLGGAVVFPHTLANVGNGPDEFAVAAVSARDWTVAIHHDVNAD